MLQVAAAQLRLHFFVTSLTQHFSQPSRLPHVEAHSSQTRHVRATTLVWSRLSGYAYALSSLSASGRASDKG